MRTKRSKRFMEEVAKAHDLRTEEVEEVVESFFRFTAEVMEEGNKETMDFDQVRLIKWGLFKVKDGRKEFLQKLKTRVLKIILDGGIHCWL